MSLLTLDETTLFYYNISNNSRSSSQPGDKVTKWIADCRLSAQAQDPLNRFDDAASATRTKATTNSNGKGKARVKVEPEVSLSDGKSGSDLEGQDDTRQKQKKQPKRPTNRDLPSGLDKRMWRRVVLPSFLNYVGSFQDPWRIDQRQVITYMQPILNHFLLLNEQHTLHKKDSMIDLARIPDINQRLNDWRSTFGSTTITVLDSFFREAHFDTQEARQGIASQLLERHRFLYQNIEERIGIFRSPLVLEIFAIHLKAVNNADSAIPNLGPSERPVGALALAAVAVERGLKLWANGHIRINSDGETKSTLAKATSKTSGRPSTRVHDFNADKWRRSTAEYVQQAMNLDPNRFDQIVEEAKKRMNPYSVVRDEEIFYLESDD
ncbi:hypothetical protein JOM56_000273 [Amanita muscaria]